MGIAWQRVRITGLAIASLLVLPTASQAGDPARGGGSRAATSIPRIASKTTTARKKSDGRKRTRARRKARGPLSPKSLAGVLGKSVWDGTVAKLSPRKPNKHNVAALVFVNSDLIDGGSAYADFGDYCVEDMVYQFHREVDGKKYYKGIKNGKYCPEPGRAVLWLNAPTPADYVVDCDIEIVTPSDPGPDNWTLLGTDGTEVHFAALPVDDHLVFELQAGAAGWHALSFQGTHDKWRLFGCTVHRVK